MNNQIFKDITIPKGASFSICEQPKAGEWSDCAPAEQIQRDEGYTGEYLKAIQGDNVAAFASPSFGLCAPMSPDRVENCNIVLKFNQDQVDWLEERIPDIAGIKTPVLPANPPPPVSNLQGESAGSGDITSSQQATECNSLFSCPVAFVSNHWLPLSGSLVILFLLVLFKDNLYRLIFADDRTKRSNQRRRESTSDSSSAASLSFDSVGSSNITYRLDAIAKKLKSIDTKVNDMEMRLLGLEQRSVSNPSRSLSSQSGVVPPSPRVSENPRPATSPVVTPPSLSIDLVKQAVALTDYSLIASHPHLFLNETQESRQGKFERKRFDVLGDQSQSSSFANAEFIAITVASQTFLIPNILPNAADPRRTMKRHVDSNSIYRAGAGSNILKIDTLATLQQLSTASYELAGLGSIE